MSKIVIEHKELLASVLKSRELAAWRQSVASELAAAKAQRDRADEFSSIIATAEGTIANRATADPRELMRAKSDLQAATAERDEALEIAADLEKSAITSGEYGQSVLDLTIEHLRKLAEVQAAELSAEIAKLESSFAVKLELRQFSQVPAKDLLSAVLDGPGPSWTTYLWHRLESLV